MPPSPVPAFAVGDRVVRQRRPSEPVRHGVVVEVYRSAPSFAHAEHPWLFAVRWNGEGLAVRGYMAIGLEREPC